MKKAEFLLKLYDDASTRKKIGVLSPLEAAFDDARNILPDEYYWFADEMPLGSTIKVTIELVSIGNDES